MYSSEASIKFAVATSRRFMKHNILEFYTDEEGEVSFPSGWFDFGGLDFRHKGQAKQLAVRQLASGEYLRPAGSTMMGVEDEALPIGTFECMNSFTKAKQQLTIGWNQGRLEITIADETLAADSKGVLYRRIQTDGITMCEIGCIASPQNMSAALRTASTHLGQAAQAVRTRALRIADRACGLWASVHAAHDHGGKAPSTVTWSSGVPVSSCSFYYVFYACNAISCCCPSWHFASHRLVNVTASGVAACRDARRHGVAPAGARTEFRSSARSIATETHTQCEIVPHAT
eukprot:1001466-Prymnesium_polylepis.1